MMNQGAEPLWIFLGATLVATVVTYSVRTFAFRVGLLDLPGARSSHSIPIPRFGGVGIICGVWAVSIATTNIRSFPLLWLALFSTLPLYLLIYDDFLAASGRGMNHVAKLILQLAASVLFVFNAEFVLDRVTLPAVGVIQIDWMAVPVTFLWLLLITNIYNFMDGIDGLAGSQGALIASLAFCISTFSGSSTISNLSVALAGGALGFLIFNKPPASIMMGDVGSAFLGFLFATFAVIGEQEGISFLTFPILLGPFLFDGTYTLARRLIRGENIFQAHRIHLYQRLVRLGVSSVKVNILYIVALFPCGISAILVNRGKPYGAIAAFAIFMILSIAGTLWLERNWTKKTVPGDSRP